jgi:hypothetical protein
VKTPHLKPVGGSAERFTVHRTPDGPAIGVVSYAYSGRPLRVWFWQALHGREGKLTLYGRFERRDDAANHVLMIDLTADPDMTGYPDHQTICALSRMQVARGDVLGQVGADQDVPEDILCEFEHRPDPRRGSTLPGPRRDGC